MYNDLPPIPNMDNLKEIARGARKHPMDLTAPEQFEAARNLLEYDIDGKNYYHRYDNPPYFHRAPHSLEELYVREGVLLRLIKVNERLRRHNLELHVFDAYRPVELQNYFFDEWVPNEIRKQHPDWSEDAVYEEKRKYWAKGAPSSDAVDLLSPPPHSTGGVVDLTIKVYDTNVLLNMGTLFDDTTPLSALDYYESESTTRMLTISEEEAIRNRRMLYTVMSEAGFVSYPREWWHYGFGDQLSSILTGKSHAVYSKMTIGG